jgi:hypothetical protein
MSGPTAIGRLSQAESQGCCRSLVLHLMDPTTSVASSGEGP